MSLFLRKISLLLLFLCIVGNVSASVGNKVLVLNSYSSDYQWSNSIIDEINAALKKNFSGVELNIEYLSSERFIDPEIWVERINMLLGNYVSEMPVAIVIISDEAWMSYRAADNEHLKDVPLFLCAVKPHSITIDKYINNRNTVTLDDFTSTEEEMLKYNATAVIREMNIEGYLSLISTLTPTIDRYALITDSRFYGIYTRLLVEEYQREVKSQKPIEYLDARFVTTDSLLRTLHTIPSNTGLLLTSWLTGHSGYEYSKQYIYKQMSTLLKTPIYITNDIGITTGLFVGGYFLDSQFWGVKMGNMLLRVLNGALPQEINTERYKDTQCQINWTVLNKFDISPDNLPESTKYINRPESIFVKYATQFILGLTAFIILLAGFIYNLDNNLKLKRAQKLTQQAIIDAYEANRNLEVTQENLKLALVNAEAADRLKSAFINNMDHEIRTPLNSIVGFSSLITSMSNKEDIEEAAIQISESSEKLLTIIKGILDLSQLEAGTATFDYMKTNLNGIFEDLINVNQMRCRNDVTIRFNPPERPLTMVVEPTRITQVLSNLIHNAIKFTEKGFIELGYLECGGDWVEFYVKDTGIGMSQCEIDQIFERFYKSDPYVPGAGLGLSIVKEIVEIMNGQYGVNSEPNVGSRFWFRIKIV